MEVFKDVIGYEGLYEVSNQGRVKSLKYAKERFLKPQLNRHGYYYVDLYKNCIRTTNKIHKLVAIAFLNHVPCKMKLVINHKDFCKTNNFVNNLEIVSSRENCNRKHIKSSSKYVGVSWGKHVNKWRSTIFIEGKTRHIGLFSDELEASQAYQRALICINRN